VEPLAEQQAAGARDVEQAARRAEEAQDAELEALLRSLSEVVSSDAQPPPPPGMMYGGQLYQHPADVAAGYMGMGHMHVALAMDKVASLGTILRQVWSPCIYFLSVCLSLPSIHFNFQPSHALLAHRKPSAIMPQCMQADELRMQALHALRQILTARQAARCFIAADDYFCRLRTLSTLWTTSRTGQLARGPAG